MEDEKNNSNDDSDRPSVKCVSTNVGSRSVRSRMKKLKMVLTVVSVSEVGNKRQQNLRGTMQTR